MPNALRVLWSGGKRNTCKANLWKSNALRCFPRLENSETRTRYISELFCAFGKVGKAKSLKTWRALERLTEEQISKRNIIQSISGFGGKR